MPDYLANREAEIGEPFVGIASDGRKWVVMALDQGALVTIKETILDPEKPATFIAWLDGALALKVSLPSDPETVRIELGADSVAFHAADAALRALWERLKAEPAALLKRQLWAQLLKIVYGRDVENDALWLQHTFLVIVAKCIALAVLGMNEDDPARLLSGEALAGAGIAGAVESDFFDWVVADAEGARLVRRIMAHVRRFRLAEVESDVLKVLYESLIDRAERHGLGEYYTPDWLAAKMTRHAIERPLEQKVLDPACGSGTFLFHALRRFLEEAEESGLDPAARAIEASQHVAGIDIHPVAVIIARVTYLLALTPALPRRKGPLSIPVYLGDALQLSVSQHFNEKKLTILVPAGNGLLPAQLDFPELLCRDPEVFDETIDIMRRGSETGLPREAIEQRVGGAIEAFYFRLRHRFPTPILRDFGNEERDAITDIGATYLVYDRLRREGRDSIWAYVARNLSRPLAYSAGGGWANIVIGNPPWVAFRHMSADLQKRFRELAKGLGVYVGGKLATQNDLAALFTARAAALYLRGSGRLAFVLPLAAMTRGQFERLRSGSFVGGAIQWDEAWTMDDSVQPLFPVPSCAVFGRRRATSKPLPETVRAYSGPLPMRDAPEVVVDRLLAEGKFTVALNAPKPEAAVFTGGSAYRKAFRQGATLVPRMLCFVERKAMGRLGADPSAPMVISRRTTQEKEPWKSLPGIENRVEAGFLRPTLLGESILPFRLFQTFEAVIPVTEQSEVIDAKAALDRGFDHLAAWMRKAESVWSDYRVANLTFVQQLDYYGKLAAQFPPSSPRVVYAKAGTLPAACVLRESTVVIDHMLYWSAPASLGESNYLATILNSETARARTAPQQATGQWGARHFDKVIFNLPIPRFDAKTKLHRDLAAAAAQAERVAASVILPEGVKFQRARGLVRTALREAGVAGKIDALVALLLDGG
jgi:SAM-dependent methyltransferase